MQPHCQEVFRRSQPGCAKPIGFAPIRRSCDTSGFRQMGLVSSPSRPNVACKLLDMGTLNAAPMTAFVYSIRDRRA